MGKAQPQPIRTNAGHRDTGRASDPAGLGCPGEIPEVEGVERAWHHQGSKVGRRWEALSSSYSIKNTEIFQNLATHVAILIQ